MPTVAPTHSIKPNANRLYHKNSRRVERHNVEAGASRRGTGGRPLCVHCCSLKAQGK